MFYRAQSGNNTMRSNQNKKVIIAGVTVWIALSVLVGCQRIPETDNAKPSPTPAPVEQFLDARVKFQSGNGYVIVEFLDDDLVHFELSAFGPGPDTSEPIFTTPMIDKTNFPGPSSLIQTEGDTLETPDLRIQVDQDSLCIHATDKTRTTELILSQICPWQLEEEFKGISFTPESFTHAYGLGQKFVTPGSADGDWIGRERFPGEFGNLMEDFNKGKAGNTQFPIVYFTGEDRDSYAVFVDNATKQYWDFMRDPWKVVMYGNALRFYLMTGPDLVDLRSDFMELVGHPLVPPKKMFGLWVSEYGFDDCRRHHRRFR
jgi:alpha-glucosidase